jgi:hypothetical protein
MNPIAFVAVDAVSAEVVKARAGDRRFVLQAPDVLLMLLA